MKVTVTRDMFLEEIKKIRPENFSHRGLGALFDYLENLEPETDFDPVAICCEFSEVKGVDDVGEYIDDCEDEGEVRAALEERTEVILWEPGCIVFREF